MCLCKSKTMCVSDIVWRLSVSLSVLECLHWPFPVFPPRNSVQNNLRLALAHKKGVCVREPQWGKVKEPNKCQTQHDASGTTAPVHSLPSTHTHLHACAHAHHSHTHCPGPANLDTQLLLFQTHTQLQHLLAWNLKTDRSEDCGSTPHHNTYRHRFLIWASWRQQENN